MKKHKGWKKTIAFVMALTLVAGSLPANVGGFLTGSTGIVANAEAEIIDSGNFGGVNGLLTTKVCFILLVQVQFLTGHFVAMIGEMQVK